MSKNNMFCYFQKDSSSSKHTELNDSEHVDFSKETETNSSTVDENDSPSCKISLLNSVSPHQPILKNYKKKLFGKAKRSFVRNWFKNTEWKNWLEYDESCDACFCFACRVYLTDTGYNYQRDSFSGYRNWKNATDSSKGFTQHCTTPANVDAMSLYQEQTIRKTKGESIKTMVVEKAPEHRTWVEVVFNVVRYLVVNGMPLRGHSENADFQSDSAEGGIYI